MKILLGILTPTEGDLLVNGADATGSRDWNRALSGVLQDFGQYRGLTVQDNVRLADIASSDPVLSALHRAGFSQYPPEAMLGRDVDGVEPSVGGWQALAIARGFYRDRGLLVLDEPTASLDPLAEEAVFQKFLMLSRGKTAIIVTHRTGTAALANRIVVFEDGRIVEQGTGAELLARGGVFSAMYRAQAEWYRRPGDASRQPPEASADQSPTGGG